MKLSQVPKNDWLDSRVLVRIITDRADSNRIFEGRVVDYKNRACIKVDGTEYVKWVDPELVELLEYSKD